VRGGTTTLDFTVLVLYLLGVTAWGAWLGRGQRGGRDYFLGRRSLPWGAVMLSVVATETSTLTFLSIPGVAYFGGLGFLQLTFGYLAGRTTVALALLPAYFRGDLSTAYQLLETRFGLGTRRFTSAIFMITRLLADSVRLFATAIPLALITGWPYPASIAVIGLLTVVYTYFGGIKAVIWVDALQMGLYLVGAIAAALALELLVPGGWAAIFSAAGQAGKTAVLDFSFDPGVPYTFWAGFIGAAFLSMASHGTDQLIVQRLLTCRNLRASQRALVGSALVVMVQFAIFLAIGLGLWAFYQARAFERPDEIFALFIVEELPPGLTGLLVVLDQLARIGERLRLLGSGTRDRGRRRPDPAGRKTVHSRVVGPADRRRLGVHPAQPGHRRRRSRSRNRFAGVRWAAGRVRAGDVCPENTAGGGDDIDRRRDSDRDRDLGLRAQQRGVAVVHVDRDRRHVRAGPRPRDSSRVVLALDLGERDGDPRGDRNRRWRHVHSRAADERERA
jgi:SSS family transporter